MKIKRPFLLWLLIVIFAAGALTSLFGVIGTLRQWDWLSPYLPATFLAYYVFRGAFLALAGLIAAWILFKHYFWGLNYCRILTIVAAFWLWFEQIVLTRNPLPFNRHLLPLIFTFLVIALLLCSLYLIEPFFYVVHHRTKSHGPSKHTQGEEK